jgi:hypothetical protein
MSTLRQAAQQALEALEFMEPYLATEVRTRAAAITALRDALAQEEPRRTGLPHCERSCEATAFQIEIRRLKAELARGKP